jgi:hypothetical protein
VTNPDDDDDDGKVVLNAPVQTDGLQEWAIRYELRL